MEALIDKPLEIEGEEGTAVIFLDKPLASNTDS